MFCSQLEKQIPQLFQNNMDIAKSARNQAELHNDAPHRARRRRAYTALKLKSERAFKNLRFLKKNRGNPESCKPDSVVPERTDIHLSARLLNRAPLAGVRHTRDVMDEQPRLLRCLAPNWVYRAREDCSRGGGLLPRLFTLAARAAVCFLLHFPYGALADDAPPFQTEFRSAVSGLSSRRKAPSECPLSEFP